MYIDDKNRKFASSEDEFINSLFQKGGTCVGYYKKEGNKLYLFDIKRRKVEVIDNINLLQE